MSLVCSLYRQVLRQLRRASGRYAAPDILCFATFGLLLRPCDFTAAGLGASPRGVARQLLSRPVIRGLPSDTPTARLAACFDVLRRLNEALPPRPTNTSNNNNSNNSEGRSTTSASGSSSGNEAMNSGRTNTTTAAGGGGGGGGGVEVSIAGMSRTSLKGIKEEATDEGGEKKKLVIGQDSKVALTSSESSKKVGEENEVEDEDEDNDEVTVGKGTLYIENSLSLKVKQLSRHVVICKEPKQLPPYRYMLPPEPLYPMNTRVSFKFPLMTDAMICMAASASINATGDKPEILKRDILTKEDYYSVCNCIPTRTITVTDHVEVEIRTEYVCSKDPDQEEVSNEEEKEEGNNLNMIMRSMSSSSSSSSSSSINNEKEYVFRYFVIIRNYGPSRNEKKWYVQMLSRHWVFFNENNGMVMEIVGPGVVGNFPLLAPGESHMYESGASLNGPSGVMRGTFQMNAYNEDGETRHIDVHIGPTRLLARGVE